MNTNKELIKRIKSFKGDILVPVITRNDVVHLIVRKADIIEELKAHDPDALAFWAVYDIRTDVSKPFMRLDAQS